MAAEFIFLIIHFHMQIISCSDIFECNFFPSVAAGLATRVEVVCLNFPVWEIKAGDQQGRKRPPHHSCTAACCRSTVCFIEEADVTEENCLLQQNPA